MQRLLSLSRSSLLASPFPSSSRHLTSHIAYQIQKAHTAAHLPESNPSLLMSNATRSHGNFDLLKRIKLDYTDVVVSKWKSRKTGLTVVHMDYEGEFLLRLSIYPAQPFSAPIVNGYFVIATESKYLLQLTSRHLIYPHIVFDDSGCPHTLEQYVDTYDPRTYPVDCSLAWFSWVLKSTPTKVFLTFLLTEDFQTAPTPGQIPTTQHTRSPRLVNKDSCNYYQFMSTTFSIPLSPMLRESLLIAEA